MGENFIFYLESYGRRRGFKELKNNKLDKKMLEEMFTYFFFNIEV